MPQKWFLVKFGHVSCFLVVLVRYSMHTQQNSIFRRMTVLLVNLECNNWIYLHFYLLRDKKHVLVCMKPKYKKLRLNAIFVLQYERKSSRTCQEITPRELLDGMSRITHKTTRIFFGKTISSTTIIRRDTKTRKLIFGEKSNISPHNITPRSKTLKVKLPRLFKKWRKT